MKSIYKPNGVSKTSFWIGMIMTVLVTLFLLFDSIPKILQMDFVVKASAPFGITASTIFWIGLVLLVSLILYLIPKTSILGAVLLTGFLGGAVAAQVINNMASFIPFPIITGVFVWGGLYLRDKELQGFFPLRK